MFGPFTTRIRSRERGDALPCARSEREQVQTSSAATAINRRRDFKGVSNIPGKPYHHPATESRASEACNSIDTVTFEFLPPSVDTISTLRNPAPARLPRQGGIG
jgi:hypothetical protein